MSLLDLAVYHLRPWLFAAAVIAPFAIRAWRRRPVADIARQVHDGPYRALQRGLKGAHRG